MEWIKFFTDHIEALGAFIIGFFMKLLHEKNALRKSRAEIVKLETSNFTDEFSLVVTALREQLKVEIKRRRRLEEEIQELATRLKRLQEENATLRGTLEQLQASYNQLMIEHEKWMKQRKSKE